MTQISFKDFILPLTLLFFCMTINVMLQENFQTRAFMSADKDETQGYTKRKADVGGNWDRSQDNILLPKKKLKPPNSISELKTVSIFAQNENTDLNTDLTNWASFDPRFGLNSKLSRDVGGSYAQVTNHEA